jgi:hypothetical protein
LVYHDMESITHVFHGCNRLLEFAKSKWSCNQGLCHSPHLCEVCVHFGDSSSVLSVLWKRVFGFVLFFFPKEQKKNKKDLFEAVILWFLILWSRQKYSNSSLVYFA